MILPTVCLCTIHMPSANKGAIDLLDLQLEVAVSHHVAAGIELRTSGRATRALNHSAISQPHI